MSAVLIVRDEVVVDDQLSRTEEPTSCPLAELMLLSPPLTSKATSLRYSRTAVLRGSIEVPGVVSPDFSAAFFGGEEQRRDREIITGIWPRSVALTIRKKNSYSAFIYQFDRN